MSELSLVKGYDATEIIRLHKEAITNLASAIDCAIKAGKELANAKEALPHGEFVKWLNENLPFSTRTAQRYMTMAEHAEEVKALEPETLSEAYKLIEKPKLKIETDDFDGEFEDDEPGELTIDVGPYDIGNSSRYPYWKILSRVVKAMNNGYIKLAATRDHTTPIGLGNMIGNLKEMASRLESWDPDNLFDCPRCKGSGQITDATTGHPTDCPLCINGKVGPYKETDL